MKGQAGGKGCVIMPRRIYPYNPRLKELARQLRNDSTHAEIRLWLELKGKKMMGYDFHRQKPLGNFIVDFFCYELDLCIEVDGASHDSVKVQEKDKRKEDCLKSLGLNVLRFTDREVYRDMGNVLREVEGYIERFEERKA